ncbi:MAG: outer membrane protein transport protein [bacterium]
MMKKLMSFFIVCAVSVVLPRFVCAEGYALYGLGSDAGGRAEAVSASIDDASAVWYNPARLPMVQKKNLVAGFDATMLDFTINSSIDKKDYTSDDTYILPNLYYAHPVSDCLTIGIGVNSPFGLGADYGKDAVFGALVVSNEIMITNIMPAAGYKLNDKLSIGAGLMMYIIDGEATQYASGYDVKMKGDANQIGGMLGLNYQIDKKQTLSLVYRSQMRFTLEGDTTIVGPGVNFKTDVKAGYLTPDAVILGYAMQVSDSLLLEADLNWRNWDDLTSTVISLKDANPLTGATQNITERNWRNAGELVVGGQYTINDSWALDGGLMYSMTPEREVYATAEIPDTSYYLVSFAPIYTWESLKVSLPLAYLNNFKKDVNSQTAAYNGEWDLKVTHVGLNLSWMF